ncbi:MAG: TlpA family protein disulfide reductase [Gammaproteobacteria bacterium]|nr:TlpA family protein disulfide reductase [Gammaproteobacteria bacterium]
MTAMNIVLSRIKKRITPFTMLVVIVLTGISALWFFPASTIPAETEFRLLDGRKLSLQDLRGRPVLVNFWATNCPPCIEELPELMQLYRELHPRGLEIIGVSAAYDPPIVVQEFVQRRGIAYPVALDLDGKIARAFGGVAYVPTTYILASNGNVVLKYAGRLDVAKARRIIAKYLKPAS